MYTIDTDKANKVIHIEISGLMSKEDTHAFDEEMRNLTGQFGTKEVTILMLLERMDPVPQECLPIFIDSLCATAVHIKRFLAVQKRTVTQMQMKRMITAVNSSLQEPLIVKIFSTKKEAMNYVKKECK